MGSSGDEESNRREGRTAIEYNRKSGREEKRSCTGCSACGVSKGEKGEDEGRRNRETRANRCKCHREKKHCDGKGNIEGGFGDRGRTKTQSKTRIERKTT